MTAATSLIPGFDEIVKNGDPKRRAEAARRISELFLKGAAHFRPEHVDLFDARGLGEEIGGRVLEYLKDGRGF